VVYIQRYVFNVLCYVFNSDRTIVLFYSYSYISAFIDLIDMYGRLTNLYNQDPLENVLYMFEPRLIYIPVVVESTFNGES